MSPMHLHLCVNSLINLSLWQHLHHAPHKSLSVWQVVNASLWHMSAMGITTVQTALMNKEPVVCGVTVSMLFLGMRDNLCSYILWEDVDYWHTLYGPWRIHKGVCRKYSHHITCALNWLEVSSISYNSKGNITDDKGLLMCSNEE